ncbi:MAG: GNAT family N-acetyltransferase [Proteobacteria bacterium]|nr:GNAT family N-acetyltransferase [Pseudomonadota bacterium]
MNLARDVEAVERAVWQDMFAAAPAPFRDDAGLSHRRFDGALAIAAANIPDTQFSRAFAFGIDAPTDERELDNAIAFLRATGAPCWWLQPAPEERALIAAIEARGFNRTTRQWAKFVRRLDVDATVSTSLSVAQISAEQGDAFGAIVCEAFGAPPPLALWLKALIGRPNWRLYVASVDGVPVSAAAMWSDGDFAWYGIAGTNTAGRGRGGQTAVLARLINDARASGARLLVAETGEKQPGAVSTSFDNMIRQGFTVAYLRPNYAPPEQC